MNNQEMNGMENELLILRIINLICDEGWNKGKIIQFMSNNSEFNLTEHQVNELIDIAVERLMAKYNSPEYKENTLKEHVAMYEHIYAYFKSINHTQGANKALQAKERLLKILNEGNRLTLKKSETIIHQSSEPTYDFSKLSSEEQEELRQLILKTRS